jgi:cell division septal protein FtsQ
VAALRRVIAVAMLGALIVAALYVYDYLTTAESFAITEVELRGLARIEDGDLRGKLADLEGENILLAQLELYEERLEMHPRVESVSMKRIIPDKIRCTVREREPVALLFADRFLEIDRHGMVMAEDEFTALLDLPIVTGVSGGEVQVGKVCEAPGVQGALEVLRAARELGGEFAADISELHVSHNGVLVRSLRDDRVLVLGLGNYESRLRRYLALRDTMERERPAKTIVDLRFEDQVVLRASI